MNYLIKQKRQSMMNTNQRVTHTHRKNQHPQGFQQSSRFGAVFYCLILRVCVSPCFGAFITKLQCHWFLLSCCLSLCALFELFLYSFFFMSRFPVLHWRREEEEKNKRKKERIEFPKKIHCVRHFPNTFLLSRSWWISFGIHSLSPPFFSLFSRSPLVNVNHLTNPNPFVDQSLPSVRNPSRVTRTSLINEFPSSSWNSLWNSFLLNW